MIKYLNGQIWTILGVSLLAGGIFITKLLTRGDFEGEELYVLLVLLGGIFSTGAVPRHSAGPLPEPETCR